MCRSASRHDQRKQPQTARAGDHLPELDYQNLVIDTGEVKTTINLQHPRMGPSGTGKTPQLKPSHAVLGSAAGQNNPNERPLSRADGRQEMTGGGTG